MLCLMNNKKLSGDVASSAGKLQPMMMIWMECILDFGFAHVVQISRLVALGPGYRWECSGVQARCSEIQVRYSSVQVSRWVVWGPGVQVLFHIFRYLGSPAGRHTAKARSQLSPKRNGVEDAIKILGQLVATLKTGAAAIPGQLIRVLMTFITQRLANLCLYLYLYLYLYLS